MQSSDEIELQALKALIHKVYERIENHSKQLEELQQEQESLAEWLRGMQHVLEKAPTGKPTADNRGGTVHCLFQGCQVYIMPTSQLPVGLGGVVSPVKLDGVNKPQTELT